MKAVFIIIPRNAGRKEKVLLMDLLTMIGQVPINIYVVIGCCVVGWLMKKFLPTDNKWIPLTLTVLGSIVFVLIEGLGVVNIIIGAFLGAASTGLHQIFAQYVEGRKDRAEILLETAEAIIGVGEVEAEELLPQTLSRNDKGDAEKC